MMRRGLVTVSPADLIEDMPGVGPVISLGSNKEGKAPPLVLCVDGSGAFIRLADQEGVARASIEIDSNGPIIKLQDSNGKDRAVMGWTNIESKVDGTVTKRPESSIVLFDKEGNVIGKTPPQDLVGFYRPSQPR